tara:strand:- start:4802 stop:5818 length:1017 start_codon:yes stop_codon:yes gene_type:complete
MIEAIYDFLHYFVFGPDLPYLQKAIEPITLALILGGTKLLTDVGQGIASNKRAKQQRKEGEKIARKAEKRIREANFTVGQEQRDLADLQKQQFEDLQSLVNRNRMAQSQQAIASSLGDPTRAASGVSPLLDKMNQSNLETSLQLGQQKTAVDQQLANLTDQVRRANLQKNLNLDAQLRGEGVTAAGLGFAAQGDAQNMMIGSLAEGVDTGLAAYNLASGLNADGSPRVNEQGGTLSNQIYRTGGEFDHDTNKKALVDEETGEKEAELTGEEVVLNPDQTESTMKAADMLFAFLKENPDAPEEVKKAVELLAFLNEPQFQGPDEVDMPKDAVEEGEIVL